MSTSQPTPPEDYAELVKVGEVLVDKYRVEQVLGAGGMGLVVAATHIVLDEKVAIKLMLPEAARQSHAAPRFVREARAAAKIKSEHVARVSDVGTLPNGTPFMVMEHLTGRDLADVLGAGGPLPAAVAVEYLLQACEALAEAHAAGIVHRDLKPANLFLTHRADGSPCIKVLDFGISKLTTASSDLRTKTSAVMGSPLYMSPEQLRSARDVDARSDIWAIGAVLFELLTGATPFDAETIPQLCMMIVEAPTPPLGRSDVPPGLEAVIQRCLEKDRERRFQHVGELAEALSPFVSGRGLMSAQRVIEVARNTRLGSASSPSLAVPAQTALAAADEKDRSQDALAVTGLAPKASVTQGNMAASWGEAGPGSRRRPVALVAVGAVALLGGIGLALVFARSGDPEAAPAQAAPAAAQADPAPLAAPMGELATSPTTVVQPAGSVEPAAPAAPSGSAEVGPSAAPAAPQAPPRAAPAGGKPTPPRPTDEKSPGASAPGGDTLFDDRK